ncbi:TldD/PmbA family protein [Dongia deserti]|uniref:TldD/PmbA family protein n=1 Tax=Dongia deserti TaxID=2268030 RepID=UPI000E6460B1|nr:TldD/PmbA family protein [Dongia deserti]
MTAKPEPLQILEDLLKRAKAKGAQAADCLMVRDTSLNVAQRLGKREKLERSEAQDLGLRVFVGKRQAIVSTSDLEPKVLDELADRAVAMARVVPEDEFCGLADPGLLVKAPVPLDLDDKAEPSEAELTEMIARAEDAARAVPGVTNSEGAEAGWGRVEVALAASNGLRGSYAGTRWGISVSVLAGEGTAMERDYDYASVVFGENLPAPDALGKSAGERAVRRLNPRKAATAKIPIVFDPRVANGLIGHFVGAINGASIARGTSFLKDKMGQQIFARGIRIIDDPHRPRGLRSKPFDGEGVANKKRALIEDGVLTTWLLDCRSARQLGLTTTGHASRGTSSPPSPSATNLYLEPGKVTPEDLMADIRQGFYVTELIGHGINGVTGDYSRGAAGYWIENGKLTHPVSEVTVAGNLKDMFQNLTPANDLLFRYGTDSPTVRIDGMTLAGA